MLVIELRKIYIQLSTIYSSPEANACAPAQLIAHTYRPMSSERRKLDLGTHLRNPIPQELILSRLKMRFCIRMMYALSLVFKQTFPLCFFDYRCLKTIFNLDG